MPRRVVTLTLVFVVIFQDRYLLAQAEDIQKLGGVLRDMRGEAKRYLARKPKEARAWSQHKENESVDARRLQLRLSVLPQGTKIGITLEDADVEGKLNEVKEDSFVLTAVFNEQTGSTVEKRFRYQEVQKAFIPESGGWKDPEGIRGVSPGKKLDVLLMDGQKIKGHFHGFEDDIFALGLEDRVEQEYDIDELVTFKHASMGRGQKILIGVGIALGTFLAMYLIACSSEYFCSDSNRAPTPVG